MVRLSAWFISVQFVIQGDMATTLVTHSKTKFSTKPFPDPPFTVKDIRAAIPQELYKIDELYGTLWFLWTHIRMWLMFFIILPYVVYPLTGLSFIIGYIIWVFIAGLSIWGSWTEGHECMHNLVSNYWLLNDIYGFLCMTPAMNPYYAAKTIHMKHHNNTAHIVRDSFPFRPNTQKDSRNAPRWFSWLKEHGLSPFVPFIGMWGVYGDITGDGDGNQYNIFDNKIYKPNIKEKFKGFLSISACIIFQILLFNIFGFKNTMIYYWGPFQVFCFWSFTMTWLHHNHPKIQNKIFLIQEMMVQQDMKTIMVGVI